jgi:tol-pal system protein YbgF
MTNNWPLFLVLSLFSLTACAPQAELVRIRSEMSELREEVKTLKAGDPEARKRLDQELKAMRTRVELLDSNIKGTLDAQKVMADFGAKTDQITTDIQLLQGRLEENNYRLAEQAQKIDDWSVKISELAARIDDVEARVKQLGAAAVATGQTATAPEEHRQAQPRTIEPSEAYRQAKSDFDKGNFDLALAGFQNYIAQFPAASQADNAQYWIGECYYALKDFRKSISAFSKVISEHPKSDKVAGAKLKIGLAYLNEKNSAKAKQYLNKVIKEHPGTNEAEIAKDRLAKIRK